MARYQPCNHNHNQKARDGLDSRCKLCKRNYQLEYDRQYRPRKYYDDIQYQTAKLMRSRLNKMIRQSDRSPGTAEVIGTAHQNFLDWIEFQFTENMDW
jgi:hypothetical protein